MDLGHCFKLEWLSNTDIIFSCNSWGSNGTEPPSTYKQKLITLLIIPHRSSQEMLCFSYSNHRSVHMSSDTQVRRKESLTFQGSSDHEDVVSLPNFKQVQMLPIPSTPSLTLPDRDGFLQSQLCLLLILGKTLGKQRTSEISTFSSLALLLQSGSIPTMAKSHPVQGFQ